MKEIVAERDKSFFLLIAAVGLLSLTACIMGLVYISRFRWFYIFGISVMGFITLVGTIGLCFPKWVIIKEGNTIIIHNGFRGLKKKTLQISDIVGVKVQEFKQQSKVKNGNIVLTIKSENSSTKDMVVINVKNNSEVVEKLNSLLHK